MSEKEIHKKGLENPMLRPRIEKVTVNISVGKSGEPLERAAKVLEQLAGQRPCKRKARRTIRDFGIRKGEPIACVVTLRREKARVFLEKSLQAVDNKLSKSCFDDYGNFSFGIKEHIEIPGTKYVPELGIYGMDISVVLGRPGRRVKYRHRSKSKVGSSHVPKPEEAMSFVKDELNVEVV